MQIDALVASLQQQLSRTSGRLVLGFSGGRDSVLLLKLLCLAGVGERVLAVHVAHGLQAAAAAWPDFCAALCREWQVPFCLQRVTVQGRANLEAEARAARRAALLERVGEHDTLLLAHHRSDQAETFWLRALRGAGADGLAAMREYSDYAGKRIWRPLLALGRDDITRLCEQLGLRWVDDPSNDAADFDRNYLRHQVLPRLTVRWPQAEQVVARNAQLLAEQAELLRELAQADAKQAAATANRLPLQGLTALSAARRYNLLHYWIIDAGFPPPPRALLERLEPELLRAPADRLPRLQWPGGVLVRFDQALWLLAPAQLNAPPPLATAWHTAAPLLWQGWRLVWQGPALASALEVGPALPGEKLLLRGHHRPLTELWRQQRIPPWEREQLPVVRCQQGVLAVGHLGQADNSATLVGVAGTVQILLSPL